MAKDKRSTASPIARLPDRRLAGTLVGLRRSLRRGIRQRWRRYRWLVTALAALIALTLGFIGFGEQRPGLSVVDRIYLALQLFRLYTDATPPFNAPLEVARWLAPLIVAYAGFRAIAGIFAEQSTQFRVRLTRDHVVICGLGRCGARLARSFRDGTSPGGDNVARGGMSVVVIERSPTSGDLEECRDLGISVLTGDATDRDFLRRAGLERARYLVVACGNDAVNSEVVSAALSLTKSGRRGAPLRCFIHIADERLCGLLEEIAIGEPSAEDMKAARFEWFNVYMMGPKALLNAHPLALIAKDGRSPHVIVVGTGLIGLNLVVEAARRWSLEPQSTRIRITLVAPDASEQCEKLAARYQHLASVCDLVPRAVDPSDVSRPARVLDIDHPSAYASTTAFVCVDDDDACLRATIQVRKALPIDVPLVTCTTGSSGVATLLRKSTSGVLSAVQEFALLDMVCKPEVLLDSVVERVAEAIHDNYLRYRRQSGQLAQDHDDPALNRWEALPETLREANRAVASDLDRRLELVGCELVPRDDWGSSLRFTEAEVELLAKIEHERWRNEREAAGFQRGPQRDPMNKTNPNLVPWTELSMEVQEIDRELVRSLPACLARGGFTIVRRHRPAGQAVEQGSDEKIASVTQRAGDG